MTRYIVSYNQDDKVLRGYQMYKKVYRLLLFMSLMAIFFPWGWLL